MIEDKDAVRLLPIWAVIKPKRKEKKRKEHKLKQNKTKQNKTKHDITNLRKLMCQWSKIGNFVTWDW